MSHLEARIAKAREFLIAYYGAEKEERAFAHLWIRTDGDLQLIADLMTKWVLDILSHLNGSQTGQLINFAGAEKPVGIRQFVEDPYFLDSKGVLYPEVMKCLEELNNGEYQEAVLTGAIGTGKTTIALFSTAYQLYLLSCFPQPHTLYGLDPNSEILFIFQSLNASLAKDLDYSRFKSMVERSPYFKEKFPFDKGIVSELRFPNRIIVRPISGSETGAIGQNVFGGIIDEMNFMAMVEKSKSSVDGGTYNQALSLYNSIARRRKSRFLKGGALPGLLCLVSSKRYPGQFTDQKEEERDEDLVKYGKSSIYVYDKTTWDIKPPGTFSGQWFDVFIGDEGRKPRLMLPDEEAAEQDLSLVISVPEEYRNEFEKDILNSLRDIAGVSTLAKHPFIVDRDAIKNALRDENIAFLREWVDFTSTQLEIDPSQLFQPDLPRFAHCDLAITGDAAGFAVGCVRGFKKTRIQGIDEILPDIWIDAVLAIRPPKGGEIMLYKVREVIYALSKLGLAIKWVSFDQFQSVDSQQLLRKAGYVVGYQSVDTTTAPYDFLKAALYDGRISIPRHASLEKELASLEKDTKKNKIDHPPQGSKDVSDALAGVVYGLTMRRENWALHGVPLTDIPASIKEAQHKVAKKDDKSNQLKEAAT